MKRLLLTALIVMLCGPVVAHAAGDPVRGEKLHADCLGCHGTALYTAPRAKIKTPAALKKEVERWNDRMNPKFSKQEIEDLMAFLNRDFYKFPL